ncbi:MAG: SMI1/KNR4 family protein [Myxococcales bacterium]|nr:SMI1/KNR4 family protein [Myxococcales bacterium]
MEGHQLTEDDLLKMLQQRAHETDTPPRCLPATTEAVADAEAQLGFALPPLYRRVLTAVGNGGFGPGFGLIGIPPHGYVDDDLRGGYLEGRAYEMPYRTPTGLVPLCNWGCGTFSHLDCLTPPFAVVTAEAGEQGFEYALTSPSLHDWLSSWLLSCFVAWDKGLMEGLVVNLGCKVAAYELECPIDVKVGPRCIDFHHGKKPWVFEPDGKGGMRSTIDHRNFFMEARRSFNKDDFASGLDFFMRPPSTLRASRCRDDGFHRRSSRSDADRSWRPSRCDSSEW